MMRSNTAVIAGGLVAGVLLLVSGCTYSPDEVRLISRAAEDLQLDDFGGAQCESWHRPGLAELSQLTFTMMIEDSANLDAVSQRLEGLRFVWDSGSSVSDLHFTRNDVPRAGDYITAVLVEHGPDEAGADISTTGDPCLVPDEGMVEIAFLI